ncbi:MAG: 16S rRNA (uracil(1498)-N(3))-methyltransferase [Oscillospiraceae bacterium]|nr:16S rRNA (uracil(1498)-N(3))-methyltransferase [Oscillospiraceae bacterium]
MPRFFIDQSALCGDTVTVTGADAVHMGRSLRMREGDEVIFCREGMEYRCTAEHFTKDSVICRVTEAAPSMAEPKLKLTVFQAYPKSDKAEYIIQNCTELGASEFVFFPSRRCVAKGDEKKIIRWSRIAEEAAKQSGRGMIPEVRAVSSFGEAVRLLSEKDLALFCYENGGDHLSEMDYSAGSIGIMIGSEGGFDRDEAESAKAAGAHHIWLGRRILRCETAPVAVTAIVMDRAGEL